MLKNYLKTAWRNLLKNKTSAFINISGLAAGMTVAILIGLWIYDELSFNKYHQQYDRIAQVMEKATYNNNVRVGAAISLPLEAELRKNYGSDFKHIALSSWTEQHVLQAGDKKVMYKGNFMGAEAPELFSLAMHSGTRKGLETPSSILIAQSVAQALFANEDPMGKMITLDNKDGFTVAGVYEDLPQNTTLKGVAFIAPWDYYIHAPGNARSLTDWNDNSLLLYVQLAEQADMAGVSAKIKDVKLKNLGAAGAITKPAMFLQPMSKWHLYAEFNNGVNTGGAIQYVWLFAIIGTFVLLLACINFMNLSTARSEKRAKEVGIRKAVGSARGQLISQFFSESLLITLLSFTLSLLLVQLTLPWFNAIAGKSLILPWRNPLFWAAGLGFALLTGLIAGSYPALYLSSFKPVKVLKGHFKAGPLAAIPRKTLVVFQFTVSIILIIGTVIVFKQIQFAQDRPIGYSRDGLININLTNDDLQRHFETIRTDLQRSNAVTEIAASTSPTTGVNNNRNDVDWTGKDPGLNASFGWIGVTATYGKTVGWTFTAGRDFIHGSQADSTGIVINEAAVQYMGLKDPVGETIKVGKRYFTVLGVIKNMIMESPYEPVKQTFFALGRGNFDHVLMKINPYAGAHEALVNIEKTCKAASPSVPFAYNFIDEAYARKFITEQRIGRLAGSFAALAIFISCLGLFGMASFMAEQRIKEIGVRKVLGASVMNLWGLLSKDFIVLVIIAILIAIPVAYYAMNNWLAHYTYRATITWWIFAGAALAAILITLLTVSYQSIRAALTNPVKSLRTE